MPTYAGRLSRPVCAGASRRTSFATPMPLSLLAKGVALIVIQRQLGDTHARRRGPDSFGCRRCRLDVPMAAPGTQHRNHCPNRLWCRQSTTTFLATGPADCAGSMEPIGVSVREDGEWALVPRCTGCLTVHVNRIAGDDNPLMLMRLAVRPLARPPFLLEWLTGV